MKGFLERSIPVCLVQSSNALRIKGELELEAVVKDMRARTTTDEGMRGRCYRWRGPSSGLWVICDVQGVELPVIDNSHWIRKR